MLICINKQRNANNNEISLSINLDSKKRKKKWMMLTNGGEWDLGDGGFPLHLQLSLD